MSEQRTLPPRTGRDFTDQPHAYDPVAQSQLFAGVIGKRSHAPPDMDRHRPWPASGGSVHVSSEKSGQVRSRPTMKSLDPNVATINGETLRN